MIRTLIAVALTSVGVSTLPAALADESSPKTSRPPGALLGEYCFDCHGEETQKGDLHLEDLFAQRPLVRNAETWKNVLLRLTNREMPPKRKAQPSDDERRSLIEWLDREVVRFDYTKLRDPGYEPLRRLTHHEYENTVRDLFGVEVSVAGRFPADLSATSGFDNSANSLFLQVPLLEKYLGVAEYVVGRALPGRPETEPEKRARERIFVAVPDEDTPAEEAVGKILEAFLPRAYRRSVKPREIDEYLAIFRQATRSGQADLGFEAAVRKTLEAVLVSPYFLFRIEFRRDTDEPHRVDDFEFASRLSYFLWSSMPDRELFDEAVGRRLHDPEVLRRQVRRMLADPRSAELGRHFASQWLGFDNVGTRVRPDPIDVPFMTDSLMLAMREESALFFWHLLGENRPISELVDADYSFLNEELARHYRIPGVKGSEMRLVAMKDPNRGGIFGHGGLLMVTARPVQRGTWILSDVLGTPPPPPPPDAGELSREIRRKRNLTPRQKLELHRKNPVCASCHDQIDPLGFSLENFDRFGRWRTKDDGRPIDAKGRLPNWTEFTGPAGLKRVIVQQRLDDLARQVTRKMLSYGLGRQLEYYDEAAVLKILDALEDDEYRFGTLVSGIVSSYPFQFRKERSPSGPP